MFSINTFWEILKVIQGKNGDITEAIKALAKSEGSNAEAFFRNVLDQIAYYTQDYVRLRNFIRDWYAALRTYGTYQRSISDIYSMPNDQTDELFRSFGYPYSTFIRYPIKNDTPLEKSNLFLDLVNLYKIKGTPIALIDVLQYYGIGEVSIYEFFLQFDNRPDKDSNSLVFRGDLTVTSTNSRSELFFDYQELTQTDPHWLYSEQQIRNLHVTNKLNLPSRTPYFGIQPVFDDSTLEVSVACLVRKIQDFYKIWRETGVLPPKDANCTPTGEVVSILALYLAVIYFFNKEWLLPTPPGDTFICFDGNSNLNVSDIIELNKQYTLERPSNRQDIIDKIYSYYDLFCRESSRNFLQNKLDAAYYLELIYPDFKQRLDNLQQKNIVTLSILLDDLGEWVKYNLSYGFTNINYFVTGIDSLFQRLKKVIDFFKPYHARPIPIESLTFRNRTFNSVIVEDLFGSITAGLDFSDFVTGDSKPCCEGIITDCPDSSFGKQYYSREFYDCGAYFDGGPVEDDDLEISIGQDINSNIICSSNLLDPSNIKMYLYGTNPEYILDEQEYVDETIFKYYQQTATPDFDLNGMFDCSSGKELLKIIIDSTAV